MALGVIWRAKRVVIVGGPLQLPPVVKLPAEVLRARRELCSADALWTPGNCSAQTLADLANPWGTLLEPRADADPIWVGSPLRVHRRCLNPMFDVANAIAYNGLMVHGVVDDTAPDGWLGSSCWIDVSSTGTEGHWIPSQGEAAMRIIDALVQLTGGRLKNDDGAFYNNVISPFKDAVAGFAGSERRPNLLNVALTRAKRPHLCRG